MLSGKSPAASQMTLHEFLRQRGATVPKGRQANDKQSHQQCKRKATVPRGRQAEDIIIATVPTGRQAKKCEATMPKGRQAHTSNGSSGRPTRFVFLVQLNQHKEDK